MKKLLIIFVALLLAACASPSGSPKPAETEYFRTLGGGFLSNINQSVTHMYGVNLLLTKPLPEDVHLVVEFENPANKNQPVTVEGTYEEIKHLVNSTHDKILVLKSPEVTGIVPHTNYTITLKVYSDASKQLLITQHQQAVNSNHIRN